MNNLFFTASIMAINIVLSEPTYAECPDLAGEYSCENSATPSMQMTVTQQKLPSGEVEYAFDQAGEQSTLITGGVEIPFDQSGFVGTRTGRCEKRVLQETVQADIYQDSRIVGKVFWITETTLTAEGFISLTQGTMELSGDTSELHFAQSCVRKQRITGHL